MRAIIKPGCLQGTVRPPASKSIMQRACAAALLHKGETTIHNPGTSADDKAALHIIAQLGATIEHLPDGNIHIKSNGIAPISNNIDCGESGLSTRLFTPIAALHTEAIQITGHGSLPKRPMNVLGEILPQLNVLLPDFNGYIPYTVQGPLQAKTITVDGSASSQFLSGLLFAYCYGCKEPVTIHVTDLKSKPYIDLTLDVLAQFGTPVAHDNYEAFYIDPALFTYKQQVDITIESDWSSAAYWLTAGIINSDIQVAELNLQSKQADSALLQLIPELSEDTDTTTVQRRFVPAFDFDATDCPDLFPILAVMAACARGESNIHGVHRLFHKESNRAASIGDMLHQFGVPFSIEDDTLCITSVRKLRYTAIDSYNDHRIVMAAAIGALNAVGDVTILQAEAVKKSYPDFFEHLRSLGADVTLID